MILFEPVKRGPEVFDIGGTTMTAPISNNSGALQSPTVYLIFVGPNFQQQNGQPTSAVNAMVAAAKALVNSDYLTGLAQYGCDGRAVLSDFTVDTTLDPVGWTYTYTFPDGSTETTGNPVWFEIDRILSESKFASWAPSPGGDATTSPIYVVTRYANNGTGAGGSYGGSNDRGPNKYTARAVNGIDVSLTSADQVDQFSWSFSHELVERISTGIGGLSETAPDSGGQLADGEPEGPEDYAWRLDAGPKVTSYWSFLDQAFVIPGAAADRSMLTPVWSNSAWMGNCVSLQQGTLYSMTPPDTQVSIDTGVQAFAIVPEPDSASIFELTSKGQIRRYGGTGSSWTAVTGANTIATALAATHAGLFMLANNDGGPSQVWHYSGQGSSWDPITGVNTSVDRIAVAADALYMQAGNDGGPQQVWRYSGSGTSWDAITGTNTDVLGMEAAGGCLYMHADSVGGPRQAWKYNGSGTDWTSVTGPNTYVVSIAAGGDVLYMLAQNDGDTVRVWQYGLSPGQWVALTGPGTTVDGIVARDDAQLFMKAGNNGAADGVWEYAGTPMNWIALTGQNTKVLLLYMDAHDDQLGMLARNNGAPAQAWQYEGSPGHWTVVA
ncbi:hypothetical protein P3T37_003932 [Kitasatospora sp. MAA4]|uniref:hypothetical protein n=1 Tax=Kitasatospora sp. MAA4 TaxID=3035093 RepID=UPI00247406CF|nr:hypothetical protein [Kitasatospora sp. MAA4]MDH6134529.1 hypothetical protein [Kitasatospora sp. MAA4]